MSPMSYVYHCRIFHKLALVATFALVYAVGPALTQELNPATVDAHGPAYNPVQVQLREMLERWDSCAIIDWAASGAIEVMHNFDRPEDKEGIYQLMELATQIGSESLLQTRKKRTGGPWSDSTRSLRYVEADVMVRLRSLGYAREMLPFVKVEGKLEKVPNAQNIMVLPTQCGTFVFIRNDESCVNRDEATDMEAPVFEFRQLQFNDTDPSDRGREIGSGKNQAYYLANYYPASVPISTIASYLVQDQARMWAEAWLQGLQTTQTVLELVPFVSSGVAVARIVDAWTFQAYGPITHAEQLGLGADVILDAIPIVAQAKKAQKASKIIYVAGVTAALAAQVAKAGLQGGVQIDDTLRLVVLAIVGANLQKLGKAESLGDFQRAARSLDMNSATGVTRAVAEISATPGFRLNLVEAIAGLMKRFTIDPVLPEGQHLQALIKGFKLDELPNEVRQAVLDAFTAHRRGIHSASDALARLDTEGSLNDLSKLLDDLFDAGKVIHEIPIAPSDLPWDSFFRTVYAALEEVAQRGLQSGSEEYRRALSNILEDALMVTDDGGEAFFSYIGRAVERNSGSSISYGARDRKITLPSIRFPTHSYRDNFGRRIYIRVERGGPAVGPGGEHAIPVYWDLEGSADQSKDVLNRLLAKIAVEEATHASDHLHMVKSGSLPMPDGTRKDISGTGFGYISEDRFGNPLPVGVVSQSVKTVNCIDWISKLSRSEIQDIVRSHTNKFDNVDPEQLKLEALDPMEMDIFFVFHERGVYRNKAFNLEYPSRILAEEFIKRNSH